jgi:hypothetical protein
MLIKDDLGDTAQASGVFVSIFDPIADVNKIEEAFTVSGVPTFLGNGIYEFEFASPTCGPSGIWTDQWDAQLTCQDISTNLNFRLTTSGIASSLDCQLFCNDIVQVTLASGLQATDGSNLEEEFNLEFLTTTTPTYSSVQKVRLEVGAFVNNLPDDILQMGLLEASLEADAMTFVTTALNSKLYKHARREYVTCLASTMLLTNVGNLLLRTKTLADLHVEYDTNGVRDAMSRLIDCLDKWEPQVISGGAAKAGRSPRMVVKGIDDIDKPVFNRMWESTDAGIAQQVPAANTTTRNSKHRRQERTYQSRFTKKRTRNW